MQYLHTKKPAQVTIWAGLKKLGYLIFSAGPN